MTNKILIPLIVFLSLITIGVASLSQLNKSPEKVALNTSLVTLSSVKSQVVISSSAVQTNSSVAASYLSSYPKSFSGTLGNSDILLNIISDSNAEYIYKGVSEKVISIKNQSNLGFYSFQEGPTTFIYFDKKNLVGEWADGKKSYPLKMQEVKYQSLDSLLLNNVSVIINSNIIPTFDYRNLTSLKLSTPNEITAINVGDCDLQTKFKTGLCKILDQNKNIIFFFNSWAGNPLLIDPTKDNITILNISQPYISCSISKYQFSYANKELKTILNLTSENCDDLNVTNEIQKYKSEYEKNQKS